jgi:hypothetical protein
MPPKTQPTAAGSHVVPAPYNPVEGDWSDGVAAATKCETGKFFDPSGLQCLECATGRGLHSLSSELNLRSFGTHRSR